MVLQEVEIGIICNKTNTAKTSKGDICTETNSEIAETNHEIHDIVREEGCITIVNDETNLLKKLKDTIVEYSNNDLLHHQLLNHETEYSYQCHRCYKTFPLKNDLSRHILSKHSKEFKALTGHSLSNGFIIFSSKNRGEIAKNFPHGSFADIGKALGLEWKKLAKTEKQLYQDIAELQNLTMLNNTSIYKQNKLKKVTAFLFYFSREDIPRRVDYFKEKLYKDIIAWNEADLKVKQLYGRCAKKVGNDLDSSLNPQVKELLKCRLIPFENRPLDGFYLYCSLYRNIVEQQEKSDHFLITSTLRAFWNKLSKDYREKYKKIAHQINKICMEDIDYEGYLSEKEETLNDLYYAAVEISCTFEELAQLTSQELLEISENAKTCIAVQQIQNSNIDGYYDPADSIDHTDPIDPIDQSAEDGILPIFDFAENIDYNREKLSIKGFSSYNHHNNLADKEINSLVEPNPLNIINEHSTTSFQQSSLACDKKHLTGYMLFSSECKKLFLEEDPDMRSEIINSSINSIWKKLTEAEKKDYGSRASKINQENKTVIPIALNPQPTPKVKKPLYTCLDCGEIFFGSVLLSKHAKNYHNNRRPYRCLNCFDMVTTPSVLVKHSRLTHRPPQRYTCKNCFGTFARKGQFLRHVRIKLCLDYMTEFKNLHNKEAEPSTSRDPLNIVSYDKECLISVRSILGPDATSFNDDFSDNLYQEVHDQLNVPSLPVEGEELIDEVDEMKEYLEGTSITSNVAQATVINNSCDNSSLVDLATSSGLEIFVHPGILETNELEPVIEEYSLDEISFDNILVEEYIVQDDLSTRIKKKYSKKNLREPAPWETKGRSTYSPSCLENNIENTIEEMGPSERILLESCRPSSDSESLNSSKKYTSDPLITEEAVTGDVTMEDSDSNSNIVYTYDEMLDSNNDDHQGEEFDNDTSYTSMQDLNPCSQTCEEFDDNSNDAIQDPNPHMINEQSSEGDATSEGYEDTTSENMMQDETFEENSEGNYSSQYMMQREVINNNDTSGNVMKEDLSQLRANIEACKKSTPVTMKNSDHFVMPDGEHEDCIHATIKSITPFSSHYEMSDGIIKNVSQMVMHGESFHEGMDKFKTFEDIWEERNSGLAVQNMSCSEISEEAFGRDKISSVELVDSKASNGKEQEEEVDILQAAIGNVFGLDGFEFSADDEYL